MRRQKPWRCIQGELLEEALAEALAEAPPPDGLGEGLGDGLGDGLGEGLGEGDGLVSCAVAAWPDWMEHSTWQEGGGGKQRAEHFVQLHCAPACGTGLRGGLWY